MIKKAMFREGHVPKGGTCISTFLVLSGEDGILLGKMTRPEVWVEMFFVGENFAPQYASSGKWLLPASHLKYGEKPDDAGTSPDRTARAQRREIVIQSDSIAPITRPQ